MKQFSLDEYLKNPDKKVVTKEGLDVRILWTNAPGNFPIIAIIDEMVNNSIVHLSYTKEGHANLNDIHDIHTLYNISYYDLYFAPEKHEGWINVFSGVLGDHVSSCSIFTSKEEAEKIGKSQSGYISTAKIEWEE